MSSAQFSFLQLLPAFVWLIIILILTFITSSSKKEGESRYYVYNVITKLFFSLAFSLFYLIIYKGGDTIAYFDGAISLNNLFFKDPSLYFDQLIQPPSPELYSSYFDSRTGYPPSWIYREPEGFFVCKIISLISFLTFKSYLATTLIIAYITAGISWRLYLFVNSLNLGKTKWIALATMFVPSVNFWCSGISKDTFILNGLIVIIVNSFTLLFKENKKLFKNLLFIGVGTFVAYHVRSIMLIATMIPLLIVITNHTLENIGISRGARVALRTFIITLGIVILGGSLVSQSEQDFLSGNSILQEASIIQQDFATNEIYGTNRYNIGTIQYTPIGLLTVAPAAILTGIFRPIIWESLNLSLLLNGFESLLFIYFFILFIRKARSNIRKIKTHQFLVFCFVFTILIAFITGLTSSLFGVLVRLRAPILPFLIILLTINNEKTESDLPT
ncbi:MAG: hypothetical protein MK066_01280 [Crocinitomicaceae bacterium]|nr:hypothetical protein [Crocinitomicaceae bacterium]